MNSIVTTYYGFQDLPKSIKRLLVTSENLFFDEAGLNHQAKPVMAGQSGQHARPAYLARNLPNWREAMLSA